MLIALSDDCPIFSSPNQAELHKFLSTIRSTRHILVQPTPSKLQKVLTRDVWDVYGEFITQSFKRAANRGQALVYHDNCSNCNPANIAEFYTLPAVLVVENATTDGDWLKFLVEKLRTNLKWIFSGAAPVLDLRQAGGVGEIPKELTRIATPRLAIRPTGTAPLGVAAFCDSDARTPGVWSDAAKAVDRTARELGISARVLSKRTIENYIPVEALRAYSRTRAHTASAVSLLEELTATQHDHFPMKDGLSRGDLDVTDSPFTQDLPLGVGFGDFISDFLLRFRHHAETQDLRRRDTANELEDLLNLIEECI